MLKSEIRKEYQLLRQQQNEEEFKLIQNSINQQILDWKITTPKNYLSYLPLSSKKEISPFSLENKWKSSPIKCYPKVISATEMLAIPVDSSTILKNNTWGIPEPIEEIEFDPLKLDAVIIPLLAFDQRGYRVGYGKGYYDRFLHICDPAVLKVGICPFPPLQLIKDIHIYDVPLNYCITPEKIYEF